MKNKTIDKFTKYIIKNVTPKIVKDFKWLGDIINRDLEKLTKKKKFIKKN